MNLPLHPALVHYPIALITFAFIFQAIHLWKSNWICRNTSMWLLGFGSVMSIAATLTGQNEAARAGQVGYDTSVIETINLHELLGNITAWGSLALLIFWIYLFLNNMEDKRVDVFALACLGLLSAIILFTSYLGGTLTFIHGVGIL